MDDGTASARHAKALRIGAELEAAIELQQRNIDAMEKTIKQVSRRQQEVREKLNVLVNADLKEITYKGKLYELEFLRKVPITRKQQANIVALFEHIHAKGVEPVYYPDSDGDDYDEPIKRSSARRGRRPQQRLEYPRHVTDMVDICAKTFGDQQFKAKYALLAYYCDKIEELRLLLSTQKTTKQAVYIQLLMIASEHLDKVAWVELELPVASETLAKVRAAMDLPKLKAHPRFMKELNKVNDQDLALRICLTCESDASLVLSVLNST